MSRKTPKEILAATLLMFPSDNVTQAYGEGCTKDSKLRRVPDARTVSLYVGAIALVILLIRTAWASEDSYISFRVVQNFLDGHGLNWNVGERVQAYTDPLFVFLLVTGTWLGGSVYWSSIVISLALTVGVYFLLMSRMPASSIMIGTAILLSSK